MDKVLSNSVVQELLECRLPITKDFQRCSFILPDGKYFKMFEHYEAYRYLVAEQLVPCIPDAEQLLSDLGYVRYSWIGYMTLPDKEPTVAQYKTIETALKQISNYRDSISVQLHSQPRIYINYSLNDISTIIEKIKLYYNTGKLLP